MAVLCRHIQHRYSLWQPLLLKQCPHAGISGCELAGLLLPKELALQLQHQHRLAVIAACTAASA